jgi:threonine dehydrogenase-like Zn-dependent dehydrogenase
MQQPIRSLALLMHQGESRGNLVRTTSIPGVYIGFDDKIPLSTLMNKAITIRTGQTHVPRYTAPLLQKIVDGEIAPSFVVTHTAPLERGPELYKTFRDKEDGCIKVVRKLGMAA